MRHIDYGLGVFRRAAFDGFPRDKVVDLAEVQKALLERSSWPASRSRCGFIEIGSHAGLQELDQLLRNKQ